MRVVGFCVRLRDGDFMGYRGEGDKIAANGLFATAAEAEAGLNVPGMAWWGELAEDDPRLDEFRTPEEVDQMRKSRAARKAKPPAVDIDENGVAS